MGPPFHIFTRGDYFLRRRVLNLPASIGSTRNANEPYLAQPLQTVFYILVMLFGIQTAPLMASSPDEGKKAFPIESNADLGLGFESNVFQSDRETQSDWYTLLDASLEGLFQPSKRALIFGFLNATFQDFFQLNQADELFANFALQYRYRLNPNYSLGMTNTLSYTDLKLLDNEGDALPMNQFESISDQIRVFGIYRYSKSLRFELGAFHRIFNVKEIGAEPSLDFKETGGDLSSKQVLNEFWTAKIRYRFKNIAYSERQANNRDGTFNNANPVLGLRRQELDMKLGFDNGTALETDFTAKYRINTDHFENDLSYRQIQLMGQVFFHNSDFAEVNIVLYFADRDYSERKTAVGSTEALNEIFYLGEIELSKPISPRFSPYIKLEISTKDASDPTREYTNIQNTLGLKGRW